MNRYLMCAYGPAKITPQPPNEAEYVATVTVSQEERYRVLREGNGGKTLWAVPVLFWK